MKHPKNVSRKRPLLILDLDETLIHGSETPLDRPEDFRVGQFYLYRRPQLSEFLITVSQLYQLAIWSSATHDYVSQIAHEIRLPNVPWQFVWSRLRCTPRMHLETMESVFIKDLRKSKRLGFPLQRTLIVDDTPAKVSRHYGNAIYVQPFVGDLADRELERLANYLRSIASEENYRKLEKRGWRTRSRYNA